MKVYLDHAATTPCDGQVVEAMLPFWGKYFGNASTLYAGGRRVRRVIEQARSKVAALVGAKCNEIIFTSGGTESNNTAVKGIAHARRGQGNHIITSSIEHHSVLESGKWLEKEGYDVTYLPVDEFGQVDPEDVRDAITDRTILISVMHANNEVGTVQPISDIGRVARERGICFHTDAVQTVGHIPVDVADLNVDLLSLSAHKLYGPQGVGALYVRDGIVITPLLQGGDQESGKRASTENVPGIVGLGKAAELAQKDILAEGKRLSSLRDALIGGIMSNIEHVKLNGHPKLRLPGNVNMSAEYVEGESMVLRLDAKDIACSTGSACTSSSLQPSHVLTAMGVSHEMAHGSLRFSLGASTTKKDIDYVLETLPDVVQRLRVMSPLYVRK